MKRLLSWLLVLVMVVGLLPMSAFAATDVDNDWETPPDIIVEFGGELNPITVEWTWNDDNTEGTASATVPAGKTYHYIYYGDPVYELSVDGVAHEFTPAADRMDPNAFTITNDTDAEKTYALKLTLPVGTFNNPVVIEEMSWYYGSVDQAAGDNEGYYYTWTAPAAGTVTFYFTELPGTEDVYDENGEIVTEAQKYVGDIRVTVNNEQVSLLNEGVDNNGLELVVDVESGDVLLINTAVVEDLEQNAYPEASYTWCGNFAYPAGSENNPISVEWTWDEDYLNATASVTVPAGETVYYSTNVNGLIFSINGVAQEVEPAQGPMAPPHVFSLTEGVYTLALNTPSGAYNNPATLVIGDNVATFAEGAGEYYYNWTAPADGTLTITMPSDMGWQYTISNMTSYVYGDTQWSDSDPVVNPGSIEVKAGDQIEVKVLTYDAANPWTAPAGTLAFEASFAEAEPEIPVDESLVFYRTNTSGGDLMLGDDIRATFMLQAPSGYSRIYLEITKDGVTTYVEKNELSTASVFRYAYVVPAAHMTMDIDVVIWGEKDGVTYRGEELVFSIRRCAEAKLGLWINNAAAAGQCKLMMNMLYYGEKAQIQFNINTDNLATSGLAQEYIDLITTEVPSLKSYPTVDESGMSATIYNMGFMLQEKVKLSVYFKLDVSVSNAEEYYVEVKHIPSKAGVNSATYTFTSDDFQVMGNNKNMILFFFDKIAPSQMRDDVEYTVYHNGEPISATYVRSMETVANAYAQNAAIADLIYALMNYADAAKAVFG